VLARSSPKIAIAAPYGLGGVPEGTASSIFRSPCESVRACMTAARVEASTGPQIRNRAPVVNATSITPGAVGTAVIGAKGVAGAVGCGTSFCSRTCAIMTSAVWRPEPLGKIIRRKLMPNLKHVTWRYRTLTPSRLAISSRLIPWATKSLISSITSGVNCTPSAPKDGLALVIVMAALFGIRRVVVVFLVGLVSDVRCDGHHEMADSG
jgi:hypothetical protein